MSTVLEALLSNFFTTKTFKSIVC